MTDEKLDPYSPEGLREIARMGMAVSGPYLREIAERLEQQASKLGDLQTRFDAVWQRAQKLDAMVGERDGRLNEAESRLDRITEDRDRLHDERDALVLRLGEVQST